MFTYRTIDRSREMIKKGKEKKSDVNVHVYVRKKNAKGIGKEIRKGKKEEKRGKRKKKEIN